MLDKNNPMALFISNICIGLSLPVRIFIKTISNPAANDAVSAINAAGSKDPSVGRIKIVEPVNPIRAAIQRKGPIFYLRIGKAKNIANTGFKNFMAVASATGIIAAAANNRLTAL